MSEPVCVFCRGALEDDSVTCSECTTRVHAECVEELLRCPTLGCAGSFRDEAGAQVAFPTALPERGEEPPAPPSKAAPAPVPVAAEEPPRPRRWKRWVALAPAVILLGGWISTWFGPTGQVRQLGGWFSGHGSTVAAIAGTFTREQFKELGNVPVVGLAWSADDRQLASIDQLGSVLVWHVASGDVARRIPWAGPRVWDRTKWVAISPDGRWLARLAGKWLELHPLDDPQGEARFVEVEVPPSSAFAAGWLGNGPRVRLLYPEAAKGPDRTRVLEVVGHGHGVAPLARGGEEQKVVASWKGERSVTGASFRPDGEELALIYGSHVLTWNLRSGARRLLRHGTSAKAFGEGPVFSGNGRSVACELTKGQLAVWDRTMGAVWRIQRAYGFHFRLALSHDGARLAAATVSTVSVWEVGTGKRTIHYKNRRMGTRAAAWSPNGELLATAHRDQTIRLWRTR